MTRSDDRRERNDRRDSARPVRESQRPQRPAPPPRRQEQRPRPPQQNQDGAVDENSSEAPSSQNPNRPARKPLLRRK